MSPIIVLLSHLILRNEFSIETVVKFSPINLIFVVYAITNTAWSNFKGQNGDYGEKITIF